MFENLVAMVVDESFTVQKIVSTILRDHVRFKQVIEAPTPGDALNLLNEGAQVDLIISGWEFTHSSGYEFLTAVRHNLDIAHIPFFIMTSHDDDETLLRALKGGATDFLIKPFTAGDMIQKIRRNIRSSERRMSDRYNVKDIRQLEMEFTGASKFDGELVDISQGGCLLRTMPFSSAIVSVYDRAELEIKVDQGYIKMKGDLLRMENDKRGGAQQRKMRAAFQFIDIDSKNLLMLMELIKSVKPDLPEAIG
jgi:two-component system chemotaxis response regulator CheY